MSVSSPTPGRELESRCVGIQDECGAVSARHFMIITSWIEVGCSAPTPQVELPLFFKTCGAVELEICQTRLQAGYCSAAACRSMNGRDGDDRPANVRNRDERAGL